MPLRLPDTATIAAEIDAARRAHQPIGPPAELATLSLRDAYAIQDAVVARRELAGAVRSGWKLGLTSRIKQHLMGIDHPLFGRIFADGLFASGDRVSRTAFIAPRVEPELAFGLAATLDPAAAPSALLPSIAWVAPALEITDSRYLPAKRSAVELVADNTSSAAYVIGERVALDNVPRLDAIETQIVCNGAVLASGITADVLGNPLNALHVLAKHLATHGLCAAVGDIILSGAITDAFPAAPGDRFAGRLRGFNEVTITFV